MPNLETLWRRERLVKRIEDALSQDGDDTKELEKRLRQVMLTRTEVQQK